MYQYNKGVIAACGEDTTVAWNDNRMSVSDLPGRVSSPLPGWESCEVFGEGDLFFAAMEGAISHAKRSIDMEMYIFAVDRTGERVFALLAAAVGRGVRVRLLVDGVGSTHFARTFRRKARDAGIEMRVFNELPWERWLRGRGRPRRFSFSRMTQRLNNRTHRKLCIVDQENAFVGSFNVTDYHLRSLMGKGAWRDTGVMIRGADIAELSASFEEIWVGRLRRLGRRLRGQQRSYSSLVRLNVTRRQRRESYLDLLVRIVGAQRRVWITNAYFVPDGSLLRVLAVVAREGVDVRILVPSFSDVVFMPWITSAFHLGLLKAGVRVFEYQGTVLHAKTMVIDDWGLIGSSNLNHRSLLHDLEADVVVSGEEALRAMEGQFQADLQSAREVTIENWSHRSLIERVIGRILLWFRYLL